MKISFKTSQQDTTWQNIADIWRLADGIEVYDGGWLFDHFYPLQSDETGPCLEAWTVAAGLATITTRLRLGHMVTSNTYRHPALVANMISTLDHLSNGRFDFGFGAGWHEREHAAYGMELPPLRERFDRFEEALAVIDALLTTPVADYNGEHYQLSGAFCEPKPVQQPRPPLVIGGRGEKRLLGAVARWADHYNYPSDDIDDFRYRLDVLDGHCATVGRDPAEIEVSLQIRVHDVGPAVDKAQDAAEAGATHVIFYLPPPGDIRLIEPLAEAAMANLG
jgi:F420-dependent oxidoreductase-like protein